MNSTVWQPPATYRAFVTRSGSLIVHRYMGATDQQHYAHAVRTDLGTFQAKDAIDARRIAGELRGSKQ